MRTTLTLDEDVAALLKRVQKKRKLGLKETVNQALRRGLLNLEESGEPVSRVFHTPVLDAGECLVGNLDNIGEVVDLIEGDVAL
ncbi:MAG TPA: hypothetical protein VGO93_02105 [Candidatus Xenobia bacterium]